MRFRTPIALCGLIAAALSNNHAKADALAVHAELVTSAPEDQITQRLVVSPDGHHVAYVSIRGSRFVVVIDGKPSPRYDEIGHTNWANNKEITFSPDGQHCMFVARKGEDQMVVVDGKELSGFAVLEQAVFSPDSKQYAFVAQRDTQNARYIVVVNGKDSEFYRKIEGLQFSSNSKHVAYWVSSMSVTKSAIQSVVVDGVGGPDFFAVHDFSFSADGNHWAYIADDNVNDPSTPGKSHLVVDGKEVATYEKIYSCKLSADGHVMYAANKRTHKGPQQETLFDQCIGLDEKVWDLAAGYHLQWFQAPAPAPVILSPDGRHVAWIEQSSNNNLYVTLDGKRGLGYKTLQQLKFSSDSQHVYYVAAQMGNGMYIVQDEDEAGPYQQAPNSRGAFQISMSPDGKHMAYQAGDGKKAFVVADGKRQASYDAFYGQLTYSPAGDHLAYIATRDTISNLPPIQQQQAKQAKDFDPGRYLILDGQQQRLLSTISSQEFSLHFSPDGKHVAYMGDGGKIAVDGRLVKQTSGNQYGNNQLDESIAFTADSKHVVTLVTTHFVIDGDEVAGYQPIANFLYRYKPVLEPDGSIFFFATKDGATSPPRDSGSGVVTSALYRVTVNPGPAREFGTTGSSSDAASNNAAPQQPGFAQQNTPTPQNPQANPSQPNNPQQPNSPQQQPANTPPTAVDKAMDKAQKGLNAAQKTKEAADSVRKLFGF